MSKDYEEEYDVVSLNLQDGSVLECPVLDVFEVDGKEYIALLHPKDDVAMLYGYLDNEDGTIEVTDIISDEEFDKVSKLFDKRMAELNG
ncbi:DUF1292 domain-containing protein [Acidaminobacter sp. JC074]|uniref:DUF1292 domain-containing protein n=1 Tax=Acidaminobacter sp. JC074 TaxID=2530199 RepID=UPI001F0F7A92|nr:DUF1292 domain-containing protein [Acidaminobacter sp. JC074]